MAPEGLGAFCAHASVFRAGAPVGPLGGRRFAVKDVFAVAGERACFGSPDWLASHPPAEATAPAVARLLEAGASLAGLAATDELAFSLTGENEHYGTPVNPAAPGRVPGGSSSGSAAAVAGGLVDFALGTDTGGSVRVPASHCGLFGFRPTHGAISTAGVLPFAPRFDTVGWLARDAGTLAAVGEVLLPPDAPCGEPLARARLLEDAMDFLEPRAWSLLRSRAEQSLAALALPLEPGAVSCAAAGPLSSWLEIYLTLQNADIARTHRAWIESAHPRFGPLIGRRMAGALAVTAREADAAEERLGSVRVRLAALLEGTGVLVLPSAAGVAPRRGEAHERMDAETGRSLTLGAVASLGGLPQVSLPLCRVRGLPLGLSLVAAPGRDRALLALARQLARTPEQAVASSLT
jgi:amidase